MDSTMPISQIIDDEKKPVPKTAIFWGREDLLEKAIESILAATDDWRVIKILNDRDAGDLDKEVARIHPEIVFVNLGGCSDDSSLAIHLMEHFPELKVITFSTENNRIEVYDRQVIWIKEASDLLSVINESSIQNLKGGDKKP